MSKQFSDSKFGPSTESKVLCFCPERKELDIICVNITNEMEARDFAQTDICQTICFVSRLALLGGHENCLYISNLRKRIGSDVVDKLHEDCKLDRQKLITSGKIKENV